MGFYLKHLCKSWPCDLLMVKGLKKIENPLKPDLLAVLEHLNSRKSLPEIETLNYERQSQGYIGEDKIRRLLLEHLDVKPLALFDFRFMANNDECQIDCLLLFQNECVLIEVKNYSGEYVYRDAEIFFNGSMKRLYSQPFPQVARAKVLLGDLFRLLGIRINISEKIVFISDKFYLYEVPGNLPVFYNATLDRFLRELNDKRCDLSDYHLKIAAKLKSVRLKNSVYEKIPEYEYDTIQKGIPCVNCSNWMTKLTDKSRKHLVCASCGNLETTDDAILRMVREYNLLFKDRKITSAAIYDWTNSIISQKVIRNILIKHLNPVGTTRDRHYII